MRSQGYLHAILGWFIEPRLWDLLDPNQGLVVSSPKLWFRYQRKETRKRETSILLMHVILIGHGTSTCCRSVWPCVSSQIRVQCTCMWTQLQPSGKVCARVVARSNPYTMHDFWVVFKLVRSIKFQMLKESVKAECEKILIKKSVLIR